MQIHVVLHGGLSQYLPPGARNRRAAVELPEGATVRDALTRLGVPDDVPRILVLDGTLAAEGAVLRAGQSLGVFPPLAGGAPSDRVRGTGS
jgi:sulfur carrier protein ThiS